MLSIKTAEEDNEEQLAIAEMNPFRYRGYYYDNETGMYYLQSRYYNPELCRFISADGFDYLDTTNTLNANAYIYCWNCPVAFDDNEGTTPEISIDIYSLIEFIKNANEKIQLHLQENFEKLRSRFNAFAEKVKFYLYNPDVFINKTLSKLLGKEVNISFRLIELFKNNISSNDNSDDNNEEGIALYSSSNYSLIIDENEKTDNWFLAALKTLVFGVEASFVTRFFEGLVQLVDPFFNIEDWYEKSSVSLKNYFNELITDGVTILNTVFNYFRNELAVDFTKSTINSSAGKIIEKIAGEQLSSMYDIFNIFKSLNDAFDGSHTIEYSFVSLFVDILAFVACLFVPELAIGTDCVNNMIRLSIDNINFGRLWG
ncbi:MAG: RHS repeat-associated core domain-containing protein [Clostridium sp.]|nr:RHS repeat-associated core domain-containing protein [Clostridium sp.]